VDVKAAFRNAVEIALRVDGEGTERVALGQAANGLIPGNRPRRVAVEGQQVVVPRERHQPAGRGSIFELFDLQPPRTANFGRGPASPRSRAHDMCPDWADHDDLTEPGRPPHAEAAAGEGEMGWTGSNLSEKRRKGDRRARDATVDWTHWRQQTGRGSLRQIVLTSRVPSFVPVFSSPTRQLH